MWPRMRSIAGPLFSTLFWRSKFAVWQGRLFDQRFGTDTVGQMHVAAMEHVPADLARHAVHYEASSIPKLRRALRIVARYLGLTLDSYSFVDFGSGKGLAVMLASKYPFKHVFGVEMTPRLHEIAESNTQKFRAHNPRATPMTLSCGDAMQFVLPEGNLVAYLYNPFDAVLMAKFLSSMIDAAADRQLLVVYVNPLHRVFFDRDSAFECLFDGGTVCVYRSTQKRLHESREVCQAVSCQGPTGAPL